MLDKNDFLKIISLYLLLTAITDKKLKCLPLFIAVTGLEPGFISPLENITVAAGRSTQFTCVVKHLGGHKVFTVNIFF